MIPYIGEEIIVMLLGIAFTEEGAHPTESKTTEKAANSEGKRLTDRTVHLPGIDEI